VTVRNLTVHRLAAEEAERAANWYRQRSPKAAARFLAEINQVIGSILDAPQRWPVDSFGNRKVRLPCFPFSIVYRETTDTIQVLAIAHGRRRPGYWKDREF